MKTLFFVGICLLGIGAQGQTPAINTCDPLICRLSDDTFIGDFIFTDGGCHLGQKVEILHKNGEKEILATCGEDRKWWRFTDGQAADETHYNGDIVFDNTHLLQEVNQAAQRAADETDGKPPKKWGDSGNGGGKPGYACIPGDERKECAAIRAESAVDVPAAQEEVGPKHFFCERKPDSKTSTLMWYSLGGMDEHQDCGEGMRLAWTRDKQDVCADKSRVLLTSEDGKKWCHKVQP